MEARKARTDIAVHACTRNHMTGDTMAGLPVYDDTAGAYDGIHGVGPTFHGDLCSTPCPHPRRQH